MSSSDAELNHWVEIVSEQITRCDCCDSQSIDNGNSDSIAELLSDHEVPEELWGDVAASLVCPVCGQPLQLDSEVVVDPEVARADTAAGENFGWYIVEESPRVTALFADLARGASGFDHAVGREFLEHLRTLRRSPVSGRWWRARAISEGHTPSFKELGPSETIGTGRFNGKCRPTFYLASTPAAAVQEATKYKLAGETVWVQCFDFTAESLVVDLVRPRSANDAFYRADYPSLIQGLLWCDGLVQQRSDRQEQERHYALPRFFAECADRLELDGFLVNSQLHGDRNLILYRWSMEQVHPVDAPQRAEDARGSTAE